MQKDTVYKALNDPLSQKLMLEGNLARLAYIGIDGTPRVVPIEFYWNGKQLVMATATIAPKVRALRVNPRVALTVDTDTQPPKVLLIRGDAEVKVVDGVPDEYLKASAKHFSAEQVAAFEVEVRGFYEQMALITVTPTWAKLLDFESRLPIAIETILNEKRRNTEI